MASLATLPCFSASNHSHSFVKAHQRVNLAACSSQDAKSKAFSPFPPWICARKERERQRCDCSTSSDSDFSDSCPVSCVREIFTPHELHAEVEKTKETSRLVVVDFYRTSCGSCKYIERGFSKLCKDEAEADHKVVFLKHNASPAQFRLPLHGCSLKKNPQIAGLFFLTGHR
jgi:thiol-disulfide isomerase/thioredoxin